MLPVSMMGSYDARSSAAVSRSGASPPPPAPYPPAALARHVARRPSIPARRRPEGHGARRRLGRAADGRGPMAQIFGKRTTVKVDGTKTLKVLLDPNAATQLEYIRLVNLEFESTFQVFDQEFNKIVSQFVSTQTWICTLFEFQVKKQSTWKVLSYDFVVMTLIRRK